MSAKVVSGKVVFMLCVCLMFGISTFFKGKLAANFAPALRNIWLQRTCSIKVTPQIVSCDQITHRSKTVLFRLRPPTPKNAACRGSICKVTGLAAAALRATGPGRPGSSPDRRARTVTRTRLWRLDSQAEGPGAGNGE